MRRRVMSFLLSRGDFVFTLHAAWLPLAASVSSRAASCADCHDPSYRTIHRLHAPYLVAREVIKCPSCGVKSDLPLDVDLSLTVRSGVARLSGKVPRSRWSAFLRVGGLVPDIVDVYDWPSLSRGAPARRLRCRPPSAMGPLEVAVVFLHQASLGVVTAPWHGHRLTGAPEVRQLQAR